MEIQSLQTQKSVSPAFVPPGGVWVLGFFDGVHAGHKKLLERAAILHAQMKTQQGKDIPLGVWTFASLPKASCLLTTSAERAALLMENGVTHLATEQFEAVSHMSGNSFFAEYLLPLVRPAALICGFNFCFGADRKSTASDLLVWGKECGVEVSVVQPCMQEGIPVSSTWIRSLVQQGEMEKASALLTRPYAITGIVEHGKALGRALGFPTANIRLPEKKAVPAAGVYATKVCFRDHGGKNIWLPGVTNVGSRPTVNHDKKDVTIETWIPDYCGNLYEQELTVIFYKMIRKERCFASLRALREQVERDKEAVAAYWKQKDCSGGCQK